MRIVRDISSPALPAAGCALTIGNFDAVHAGHQQILARLKKQGDRLGLPVVVMTFDPHPEEFFLGDKSSARLTDCSTRFFALKEQGVDVMLLLRFNRQMAATAAEDFIRDYLVEALNVRYLLIGDDFRFGKNRLGDFALLQKFGSEFDFEVADTPTIEAGGERISSTRIRGLLDEGKLDEAAGLLGRRYNLVGRVGYGQQLGRQWGFPTLNLPVNHHPAVTGVFAVRVHGLGDKALAGVANLGKRPTVGGIKTLLEVHLLDFNRSVYGQRVCVEFVEKIRNEEKFDSFDALKAQILQDTEQARGIMADRHHEPVFEPILAPANLSESV